MQNTEQGGSHRVLLFWGDVEQLHKLASAPTPQESDLIRDHTCTQKPLPKAGTQKSYGRKEFPQRRSQRQPRKLTQHTFPSQTGKYSERESRVGVGDKLSKKEKVFGDKRPSGTPAGFTC